MKAVASICERNRSLEPSDDEWFASLDPEDQDQAINGAMSLGLRILAETRSLKVARQYLDFALEHHVIVDTHLLK